MAISVTTVGVAVGASGSTISLSGLSIPIGALIAVGVNDNLGSGGAIGSISDSASNLYVTVGSVNNGGGAIFGAQCGLFFVNAIPSSVTSVTYTRITASTHVLLAGLYATGVHSGSGSTAIDVGVVNHTTGSSTSPAVTSGTPAVAGELFLGWLGATGSSASFNQDTTDNWTNPFDSSTASNQSFGGGGNQVNAGSLALKYAPTLTTTGNWAIFIAGFKPPDIWQGTTVFDGAGTLLATAGLAVAAFAIFGSTGSLSVVAVLQIEDSAQFIGQGSLTYAGILGLLASATLPDNSPSLSAYANVSFATAAEFDSSGQINAAATRVPPGGFVALFNGSGVVSANAQQSVRPAFTFAGNGQLLPTVFLIQQASVIFAGSGLMQLPLSGESNLNATGSLEADTIWNPRIGFFTGMGSLSASGYRIIAVDQQLNGAGRMCVQATVRLGRKGPTNNVIQFGPGPSFNITVGGG